MSANETVGSIEFNKPVPVMVAFGLAYSLIFLCAIVGNILVVAVVVTTPCMHTVTNLFISNLALADVMVAIVCIPLTFLDNISKGWPFGAFLCKVTPYIQGVSVNATAYLLVAIAVDRFRAICLNKDMRIMKRNAIIIICVIWGLSFILMIPWAIYYERYDMVNDTEVVPACSEVWTNYDWQRSFYVVVLFMGTYLIPLTIISFCYILIAWRVCHRHAPGVAGGNDVIRRCKVNVVKMLATVVLMFAISWLPLQLLYMLIYFYYPEKFLDILYVAIPIAQWMGLSNSGMNAFIYGFFSQNFRRGFKRLFNWLSFRKQPSGGNILSRKITRTASVDFTSMAKHWTVQRSGNSNNNGNIKKDCSSRQLTPLKSKPLADDSASSSWASVKDQTFL